MIISVIYWVLILLVFCSFIYYLVCVYSAARFFQEPSFEAKSFTPAISLLKPLYGCNEWTYECLSSFCNQDYPDYEIVFGVKQMSDPAVVIVNRLRSEFPKTLIKLIINPNCIGFSAKVNNLHNIFEAASNEILVISDSDARVNHDYLRKVVAPFADKKIGLVTCLYRAIGSKNIFAILEGIGFTGEFALGVLVAKQLEGVKFAFGSSISIRKNILEKLGGFSVIANYLNDDFLLGNLTAELGYKVYLSRYVIEMIVPHYKFKEMFLHQLRWRRSTKYSRPFSYVGLIFTYSTIWSILLAILFYSSWITLSIAILTFVTRLIAAWIIGVIGFQDLFLRRYFYLLPLMDLLSFVVWLASFFGNEVIWSGARYRLKAGGELSSVEKLI